MDTQTNKLLERIPYLYIINAYYLKHIAFAVKIMLQQVSLYCKYIIMKVETRLYEHLTSLGNILVVRRLSLSLLALQ